MTTRRFFSALGAGQPPTDEIVCAGTFFDGNVQGFQLFTCVEIDKTPACVGTGSLIHKSQWRP
ncbi:hypothetical protein [Bradyrhizobium sp. USDA 4454]